jgi:uncharacterized protein YbdZ (MbtH family)
MSRADVRVTHGHTWQYHLAAVSAERAEPIQVYAEAGWADVRPKELDRVIHNHYREPP